MAYQIRLIDLSLIYLSCSCFWMICGRKMYSGIYYSGFSDFVISENFTFIGSGFFECLFYCMISIGASDHLHIE